MYVICIIFKFNFFLFIDGAEIIAIDAFNKSKTGDEFVIGITLIKPSCNSSIETYLNIYTESVGEGEVNTLEAIAQNCLMLELSYTPYLLYHTAIPNSKQNEVNIMFIELTLMF